MRSGACGMCRLYFFGVEPRFCTYSERSTRCVSSTSDDVLGALPWKLKTELEPPGSPSKSFRASCFLYASFAGDAFAAGFSGSRSWLVSSKCETVMSIAARLGMKRS